jgi:hypothetical protein
MLADFEVKEILNPFQMVMSIDATVESKDSVISLVPQIRFSRRATPRRSGVSNATSATQPNNAPVYTERYERNFATQPGMNRRAGLQGWQF